MISLISTHTPVKGVTLGELDVPSFPKAISTHTPVKGVTVNNSSN